MKDKINSTLDLPAKNNSVIGIPWMVDQSSYFAPYCSYCMTSLIHTIRCEGERLPSDISSVYYVSTTPT